MPAGAIAIGVVDLILLVQDIFCHLLRLKNTSIELPVDGDAYSAIETDRLTICGLLRTHLGHDFRDYRRQTFLRRVERRMAVVNTPELKDYIAKLRTDPAEISALFRDLLIRVTSFFRDQETFEILASKIIPPLFNGKMADGMVRLWVPGCATGEEAYSLAMLLREQMDSLPAPPKVQVFATDIDDLAITTARFGRYPKTLLEGLSPERLRRFFTLSQDMYCVTKEIRELCTFLRSQSGSRSAVFDDEFALVPKFTHLHEPLASGSGHPDVSLLACSWGYLAFGGGGISGAARESIRDRRQTGTHFPSNRGSKP